MTLAEFKAWFEGYTEGITGAPTEAQFDRIKKKVAAIDGAVTTYPVYVDWYRRYRDALWDTAGTPPLRATYSTGALVADPIGRVSYAPDYQSGTASLMGVYGPEADRYQAAVNQTVEFDPHAAMYALGKAEAEGRAA